MREVAVYAGEIIQCPECEMDIAKLVKDAYRGEILYASQVKGIHYELHDGDALNCRECGTQCGYSQGSGLNSRLHIKKVGWV